MNSEQFYIVSDVVDELKKRYDVTLLRKNMSYRQLDDYLDKKLEDSIKEENGDGKSKQMSFDDF